MKLKVGDIIVGGNGEFHKVELVGHGQQYLAYKIAEPNDFHKYKSMGKYHCDGDVYRRQNGIELAIERWIDSDVD